MGSHTATGEWKSFEIRMRRRRAERLVLRADVAASEGCLEEARALIDEARTLWSSSPGLADVEGRIDAAATPLFDTSVDDASHRTWTRLAVAAICVACAGGGAAILLARPRPPLDARDEHAIVDSIAAPEAAPITAAAPVDTVADPEKAPLTDLAATDPVPIRALPARTQDAAPVSDLPRPSIEMPPASPPSERVATPSPAADETPIDRAGPIAASVAAPVEASVAAPVVTSVAAPVVTSVAAPIDVQPPPDALVRGALAGYAKAYSNLDVDAAQRIWPSVDRDGLARAFESLASQRVSLGDCRIQVDGSAARARCAGSATWRPKVGGGERTDRRSWTFELEKAPAGWQIVSARVQNR